MVTFLLLAGGLTVLTAGAELLVRGATRLAALARVSPLAIGLTVVAYGTSTPELTVSVLSAAAGEPDIALGNVVGSNIFNVLFILGVSALIVPLGVHRQLLRFDVPLMVGVSLIVWLLAADGRLGSGECGAFALGIVAYTVWSLVASRREGADVQAEYAAEFAPPPGGSSLRRATGAVIIVAAGLGLLVLGTEWFVEGAKAVARLAGLSELVIGLTVVAAGTSLPEVATSITAALKGERDIAVGNVIGSNLFNLLGVLGFAGLTGGGIAVADEALRFDLPVMTIAAGVCLPIFWTGHVVSRVEGLLFLAGYATYAVWLILSAYDSPALPTFRMAILAIALPLASACLAAGLWRQSTRRPAPKP